MVSAADTYSNTYNYVKHFPSGSSLSKIAHRCKSSNRSYTGFRIAQPQKLASLYVRVKKHNTNTELTSGVHHYTASTSFKKLQLDQGQKGLVIQVDAANKNSIGQEYAGVIDFN